MKTKVEVFDVMPMTNGEFMIDYAEDNEPRDFYIVSSFLGHLFQSAVVLGRNQVRREIQQALTIERGDGQ